MKLSDCAILVRENVHPSEVASDTKYIGLEHMAKNELHLNGTGKASDVFSTKQRFRKNDILLGKLGVAARKIVQTKYDGICSTDIWVIRAKQTIDRHFLFYWCASKNFINRLSISSDGTIMPRAKWEVAKTQEIPDLSIVEQQKIGSILGRLDRKIEINRMLKEYLEAFAKSLFKSWFVDFDPIKNQKKVLLTGNSSTPPPTKLFNEWNERLKVFPSEFIDSKLGKIPKGWRHAPIRYFGSVVCGKTPSTRINTNFGGDYPFITIPDMHNTLISETTRRTLSDEGKKQLLEKLLPAGTICVSCIATPGLVVITSKPSFTNQQINSIIPFNKVYREYLMFSMLNLKQKIQVYGDGGSVFTNLSTRKFKEIPILLPDLDVICHFHILVDPLIKRIRLCIQENKVLSELRDLLLPKLITGELPVQDAMKILEEERV